jgi:hypothetical protein
VVDTESTVRQMTDQPPPDPLLNQGGELPETFSCDVVSRRIMESMLGMTLEEHEGAARGYAMNFSSKGAVAATNEPVAGPGDGIIQGWPDSYFLVICSLVLFCFCLATRIPLQSSLLSGWDPVQFALAIHHFDINRHQPQPPGYILYVGLAKMLFRLVHDDNLTLTILAALFSALSTVLIFLLAFYMYGRRTALLASALWATCPFVWFHGLVGEIYAAAGFGGLATALSVFFFLRSPSTSTAVLLGGVYALAGGLRPDQIRFDQSVKRRYFAQIRKLLLRGNSAVVLIQLGPPDCLNLRVLQYYFPNVPVYTALGLSDPVAEFRQMLSIQHGNFRNKPRLLEEGKGGERSPTLAVAKDRVLLLHSRSLQVEVNARDGSARELVAEDRDGRLDIYQIYVLSLTPTSSVDITSGGQTISIVE